MNLKNIGIIVFGLFLAGCNYQQKFDFTLTPTTAFSVTDDRNQKDIIHFEEGVSQLTPVSYSSRYKTLTFHVNNSAFTFYKVSFDSQTGDIYSSPSESGQATVDGASIGIQGKLKAVCANETDPASCENKTIERNEMSCTYFETIPVTRCYPNPYGGMNCYTEFERIGRSGRQWVEVTTVSKEYAFQGEMFTENLGPLAQGMGGYVNEQRSYRELTYCR